MSGPFVVVVAGLCTAWLAFTSDDRLVATDYYKQGLAINRKISRAGVDPAAGIGATSAVAARGEVRVQIAGLVDPPPEVRLTLVRPDAGGSEVVLLRRDADADYIGTMTARPAGRWVVTLESKTWRLPTTITDRLSGARLGLAERRTD
jgi:hypothetical protein